MKQEGRAIAKMTVRCTLHMDALKIFESPWQRPRLLSRNCQCAFVAIDRMKVRTGTKCAVRGFIPGTISLKIPALPVPGQMSMEKVIKIVDVSSQIKAKIDKIQSLWTQIILHDKKNNYKYIQHQLSNA